MARRVGLKSKTTIRDAKKRLSKKKSIRKKPGKKWGDGFVRIAESAAVSAGNRKKSSSAHKKAMKKIDDNTRKLNRKRGRSSGK